MTKIIYITTITITLIILSSFALSNKDVSNNEYKKEKMNALDYMNNQ